ncbi:nucleic acid-binding protein [Halosimplex marinum]|uniref:nucleic acid-binding protein n=1 Tax=Halosimplex marinum TaxID=3396620 RepID=UPI003F57A843
MTIAAVSDAGPLIHLAGIDSLELVDAFDRLFVPETVYEELNRGGLPEGLADRSFELVAAPDEGPAGEDLDPGERAALAVASDRDAVLLTDDLAARAAASESGIDVHGSFGVIAVGYSRGLVDRDEAAALMRALQRETSLFVTDAVVERGIQMLDDA